MPFYEQNIVEEVQSRSDIVDVISQYVRLQKKGSNYYGLCPFHNEKTGSFSVSSAKQMFYCFGCGAGGNVFTFLMEYENFTFSEAVEALAERAGVELPKQEYTAAQRRETDRRQRLLDIHKEAATYYYMLLRNERGARALEYFKNRGLSSQTMQKFGLGYADQYSDDLYRYLHAKGYEDDVLKDSGLVSIDERRGAHDKFWNRAMFPIMDVHNKVIGFGGRVMGEGEPKYLNSPETRIFDKGRNLYGLNFAKNTKRQQFLLCEGYMDVIALHQAGFDNAVASLGTSLTTGHAGLLKRYAQNVYLTYDSDGAGMKAALRAIPILREAGIAVKVINLKPYKDPDEFIKALGADAYQERIDQAENGFMFEIRMAQQQYDMHDPEGKTAFYKDAARRLCVFTEKLERDNYIDAVASQYGIAAADLQRLVHQYGADSGRVGTLAARPPVKPKNSGYDRKKEDGMKQSQKLLLTWLASDTGLFPIIRKYISPEDFTGELYYRAAQMLFAQFDETGTVNPAKIISMFPDGEEQKEIAGIFHATIQGDWAEEDKKASFEKALKETVIRVKTNSMEHRLKTMVPTDMEALQRSVADKRALEELKRVHISID